MDKRAFVLLLLLVAATAGCNNRLMILIKAIARGLSDDAASGAGSAARRSSGFGDDATRASGFVDDAAHNATFRGVRNISQAAWSRLTSSLDEAIRVNNHAGQYLSDAAAKMSPRALAVLQEKFHRNQVSLQSEIDRAQAGYQSDAECAQATTRIRKLSREQAAIASLIEKMG